MSRYITLLSSLPHLPHYTKARELPISRMLLLQRLKMLPLHEQETATLFLELFSTMKESYPEQKLTLFEELINAFPSVRPFVTKWLKIRTLLSALRIRRHHLSTPITDALPRAFELRLFAEHLERHWQKDSFGVALEHVLMQKVENCFSEEEPLEMLHSLHHALWRDASSLKDTDPFSFSALIGYLQHWIILEEHLGYEPSKAYSMIKATHHTITEKALHEYPFF